MSPFQPSKSAKSWPCLSFQAFSGGNPDFVTCKIRYLDKTPSIFLIIMLNSRIVYSGLACHK